MEYLQIRTPDGIDLLQESCRGIIIRYTDLDGNTVDTPAGSIMVGEVTPEWALPDLPEVTSPPVPLERRITKLAFMSRFTDTEAIMIDLASQGNTVEAATMRRYQAKVNAASWIDLDRSDTRMGVQALEMVGLLQPGRASIILDMPVQPHEVYTNA